MVYEHKQQAAMNDVLVWLEDELRETKAQIGRLEQGLAESEARMAELLQKVNHAENSTTGVSTRLAEIPQIAGQIGAVRSSLAEVEERALTSDRRLSEGLRVQQLDAERLRQELNGTYRRIEAIERAVDTWSARFDHLEEVDRRVQEALALVRHQYQDLERRQDAAEAAAGRGSDTYKRFEFELSRLSFAVDEHLQRQTAAADRVQAFNEAVRRLEEQNETIAVKVVAQQEIFEKIDLLRAELRRLEERLSGEESHSEEHRLALDDDDRLIGLLDGKVRGLSERLSNLRDELETHRGQIIEQFRRLHETFDRQKRREIESIERDLRELKLSALHSPDDAPPS